MLSAHFHHGLSRALAAEDGVSLIELLVSILAGMIVIIALFNLQIVTLHQTTRVFTKVDATQHARVAIENLENELHSACVADNVTPIQAGSTRDEPAVRQPGGERGDADAGRALRSRSAPRARND